MSMHHFLPSEIISKKTVISADDVSMPSIEGIQHKLYWDQWGRNEY